MGEKGKGRLCRDVACNVCTQTKQNVVPLINSGGVQADSPVPAKPGCAQKENLKTGILDKANSFTYIDGPARKIQTKLESVDEAGTQIWITTDIYYNQIGKNDFTSVPYESTTSAYTVRPGKENQIGVLTEFDDMGRVIKTTNTDTTFSRVFYGKKAVVFVDENNNVT